MLLHSPNSPNVTGLLIITTYTLTAIGINEELLIDILSQTPLMASSLNFANDAEMQQKKKLQ